MPDGPVDYWDCVPLDLAIEVYDLLGLGLGFSPRLDYDWIVEIVSTVSDFLALSKDHV